jgi:hypothetical protein
MCYEAVGARFIQQALQALRRSGMVSLWGSSRAVEFPIHELASTGTDKHGLVKLLA